MIGILLGPISAKFIDTERWGSASSGQTSNITLVSLRPPTARIQTDHATAD